MTIETQKPGFIPVFKDRLRFGVISRIYVQTYFVNVSRNRMAE